MRRKYLMLFAGLLFALIISEIALRIDGKYTRHLESVARRKALHKPVRWFTFDQPVRRSDVLILVLGDSFSHGVSLNLEQTWPKQLEKLLSAYHPQKTFNVINYSTCGEGIPDYRRDLKTALLQITPQLILQETYLNDYYDPPYTDPYAPAYKGPSDIIQSPKFIFHIQYYLWKVNNAYPLHRKSFLEFVTYHEDPALLNWPRIQRDYLKHVQVAGSKNIPFVTALVPPMIWRDHSYPLQEFHRTIKTTIGSVSPFYIDLLPGLEDKIKNGYDYWLDPDLPDAHPNAAIHALYAHLIFDFLMLQPDLYGRL